MDLTLERKIKSPGVALDEQAATPNSNGKSSRRFFGYSN